MTKYDWALTSDGYIIVEDLEITDDTKDEEIFANELDAEEVCKRLTNQEEYIQELESKLLQVSSKMCYFDDIPLEFQKWYYTEIAEPSEGYNEEALSKILHAIVGGNR